MAEITQPRVFELSTTAGAGAFTLAGAPTGFRTFASVCAVADTLRYVIEGVSNGVQTGEWEVGTGTYSAANTLTRTTVEASSNANAAVNFGAGTKRVSLITASRLFSRPVNTFFVGVPTADETLLIYVAAEAVSFPANFGGSRGKIGINPTASFVLTVYKNPVFTGLLITGGTVIGTLTVSTAGVFTFATTGGVSQVLAAGDTIGVKGPTTPDATAACGTFNLLGAM